MYPRSGHLGGRVYIICYMRVIGSGLWEVRTSLPRGRIARVVFGLQQGRILVLHGFFKKTSPDELALARRRNREFEK